MFHKDEDEKQKLREKVISLSIFIAAILLIGTVAYARLEGWSIIDALFYSTAILTKSYPHGIIPLTPLGRIFTIIFMIFGLAIIGYALSILGNYYVHYLESEKPKIKDNIHKAIKNIISEPPKERDDRWIEINHRNRKI